MDSEEKPPQVPEGAAAAMQSEGAPASEPSPEPEGELVAAGFWVRGGAYLIDALVTLVLIIVFHLAASLLGGIPWGALTIMAYMIPVAYATWMVGSWGATLGKMAAGVVVVRPDGTPVSYGRALGRALASLLSGFMLALGYLLGAFTPGKRTLHDYIAGTRVVYAGPVGLARQAVLVGLGVLTMLLPLAIAALAMTHPLVSALLRKPGEKSTYDKFGELKLKSKEGSTKGNIGLLKSKLAIYYGEHEGVYPARLEDVLDAEISQMPMVDIGEHPGSNRVTAYGGEVCGPTGKYGSEIDGGKIQDSGGWGYVGDEKSPCWGTVFVDCTHADTKGTPWHSY